MAAAVGGDSAQQQAPALSAEEKEARRAASREEARKALEYLMALLDAAIAFGEEDIGFAHVGEIRQGLIDQLEENTLDWASWNTAFQDYATDIVNGDETSGSAAIIAALSNDLAPGAGNIVLNALLR